MIDWVTAYCAIEAFSAEDRAELGLWGDRVVRYTPRTGEQVYETAAWDSIRSDTHGLVCRVSGSAVWIQGSPARVIGRGSNVFGEGASAAEDLPGCVQRMVAFGESAIGVRMPAAESWEVNAVDITRNLALASSAEVRQMLSYLRGAEGGRIRVSAQAGDSVYWNTTSRYLKGKAYHKGPDLRHRQKKRGFEGARHTDEEMLLADRLLRLEVRVYKRHWKRNLGIENWRELTSTVLDAIWQGYFGKFIGTTIMNDQVLRDRISAVHRKKGGFLTPITESQARSAYSLWFLIQNRGWELAKEDTPKTTWYRLTGILRDAGLTLTDMGNGNIVPFRAQKLIVGHRVNSWQELRHAA